jgi:hypothetical protein
VGSRILLPCVSSDACRALLPVQHVPAPAWNVAGSGATMYRIEDLTEIIADPTLYQVGLSLDTYISMR